MNNKINVVMLCGDSQSSRIMFNGIASHVNIECVITENNPSRKIIIGNRKIGILE